MNNLFELNHIRLENDAELFYLGDQYHQGVTFLSLCLQTGSMRDPDHLSGLAHFFEHMIVKGTKYANRLEIARFFDEIGCDLDIFTTKTGIYFSLKIVKENTLLAIQKIQELLLHSVFLEKEVEIEKRVIQEEISMYDDMPEEAIVDEINALTFSSMLGKPILGTKESIESISSADLYHYQDKYVNGSYISVMLGGDLYTKLIHEVINCIRAFPAVTNELMPINDHPTFNHHSRTKKTNEHGYAIYAFPGAAKFTRLSLVDEIIAEYLSNGFSSVLYEELREKRQLVYYADFYPQGYYHTGINYLEFNTTKQKIKETHQVLMECLNHVAVSGIDESDLVHLKERLVKKIMLEKYSTHHRLALASDSFSYRNKVLNYENLLRDISAVSLLEINERLKKLFIEKNYNLVIYS